MENTYDLNNRESGTGNDFRRVAVFGISRSGKDYSIGRTVSILNERGVEYEHVSSIGEVQKAISGRKLSEMTQDERSMAVADARSNIRRKSAEGNVIVDEHYCFPNMYGGRSYSSGYTDEKLPYHMIHDDESGRDYEVVSEDRTVLDYDTVFYIDTDSATVLGRFRNSEGSKRNTQITLEDIESWKSFEKRMLKEACASAGVPFITLHDPESMPEVMASLMAEVPQNLV